MFLFQNSIIYFANKIFISTTLKEILQHVLLKKTKIFN